MREPAECAACAGKGTIRCVLCQGNGRVVRSPDGGIYLPHTPLGRMWRTEQGSTCPTCQGTKRVTCKTCAGTGRQP